MKEYDTRSLRNVALAAHGGTGKTSLAEAMLFESGAINRLGRAWDVTGFLDDSRAVGSRYEGHEVLGGLQSELVQRPRPGDLADLGAVRNERAPLPVTLAIILLDGQGVGVKQVRLRKQGQGFTDGFGQSAHGILAKFYSVCIFQTLRDICD